MARFAAFVALLLIVPAVDATSRSMSSSWLQKAEETAKLKLKQKIEEEKADISMLEAELAEADGKLYKMDEAEKDAVVEARDEGVTLFISMKDSDCDPILENSQIFLRLKPVIDSALPFVFHHRRFLIFDNQGVKMSQACQQNTQWALGNNFMDGILEVDHAKHAVRELQDKAGVQFSTHEPRSNHMNYWMVDQCKTRYLVHFNLHTVAFTKRDYSWVDHGLEVMRADEKVLQVVLPIRKGEKAAGGDLKMTKIGDYTTKESCKTKRSFISRMYLLDTERYNKVVPISADKCKVGHEFRWEEAITCQACEAGFKRADLQEQKRGWHMEFDSNAKPWNPVALKRALSMISKGQAVTSKLTPYRAAAMQLWEMDPSF